MSSYFLLIEEDAVIATDITETLSEAAPDVEVLHFQKLGDAMSALTTRGAPTAAIVNWPYIELSQSPLDGIVSAGGGRIVVTRGPGKDQETAPDHWILLPSPFTSEMLKDSLKI